MQDFLEKSNEIVEKYEIEEIKSANHFNLFSILDRETDEVKTHSALIAELLNPKGSHGQGNIFLGFFIDVLSEISINKTNSVCWEKDNIPVKTQLDKIQVYKERNVGVYRGKECRLDLLLFNNEYKIVIENKFNAKQGEKQLERYSDYLKPDIRKTFLIYLTKEGEEYKSNELKEGIDYGSITYKEDILNWLERCREICTNIPILQQSLSQYINLIKKETNQTVNYNMKSEIQDLILKNGIKGISEVVKNYENAFKFIADDMRNRIINKLKPLHILQNIKMPDCPFFSIFFDTNGLTIGIEAFNIDKNSFQQNSLFIGKLDFEQKEDPKDLIHSFWLKNSIEKIWNENEKLEKLNEYGKYEEKRNEIAQEIVDYVKDYIERIAKN